MKFLKAIVDSYHKFKATKFGRAFVRTQYRSACLLGLTIAAAAVMEFLVQSARFGGTDLAARFPEMIQILRALSILTWFEQGLLWIRLAVSPKIDFQDLANRMIGTGADSSMATCWGVMTVYVVNHLVWLARILILLHLCEF